MSPSLLASLISAVILTGVAFAHAVGPAIFLIAIAPFDAIPFQLFGVAGNAITFVPILIFLARVNPGLWGHVFFGSRIQQIAFFLVLSLLVAHAAGILTHGIGEIFNWLRFVTLFILLGVFVSSLQREEHVFTLAKVMVVSMVALTVLSAMDFYMGIQILPIKVGELAAGALKLDQESYERWRFTGAGFPVNRYGNYLLPVTFLSVGWFMRAKSPIERLFVVAMTGILVFAELLSVSRSALLAMAVGAVLLMPLALGFGVRQVLGVIVIGGLVGGLIAIGLEYTEGGTTLGKRFESETLGGGTRGRVLRWFAAIKIWANAPFLGVGWGHFKQHSVRYIAQGGLGAHNSYFKILAEAGLLAFVPMIALIGVSFVRLFRSVRTISPELDFWRPYFFCGLVAQLISNFFNDYFSERYLWFTFAFAAVLERLTIQARAKIVRERQEYIQSLGSSGGFQPTATTTTTREAT